MIGKSIPCACAVKLWTRSRFTDREPESLSENCDDPSLGRSPGSAGGARIHQTLESENSASSEHERTNVPAAFLATLSAEGFLQFTVEPARGAAKWGTESPTAGYTRASGCVLPSRSLAPSPSLSLSLSISQVLASAPWDASSAARRGS